MISFDVGGVSFGYRAAGIAIHQEHVLPHRAITDDFWALPGGRCEAMERSEDALRREMLEEFSTVVRVERLVWVVENFFRHAGTLYHELGLYFRMALPPGSPLLDVQTPFAGLEGARPLIFQWFPLATLPTLTIYPVFLRGALQAIPDSVQHIVNVEGTAYESTDGRGTPL